MADSDWQTLLAEASALRRAARIDDAIAAYRRLLSSNADLPDSWYNLGWLLRQARHFEQALEAYGEALQRGVTGPEEVRLNRAAILADHLSRPDDARAELKQALQLKPHFVPALLNLGNLEEDLGHRDEAQAAYRRALVADPANALALSRLAGVSRIKDARDPLIDRLRNGLDDPSLQASGKADVGFALARLLDMVGEYDGAFEVARAANAASRASFGKSFAGYDPAAQEAFIDRLIAAFPAPVAGAAPDEPRDFLFICGMFRSGSTLTEQILASHSKVSAGGELDLIPAIVEQLTPYPEAVAALSADDLAKLRAAYVGGLERRGLSAPTVTDKRPDNFLHIGLIKALFPGARIVHTRRDPLDNLVSLYFLHLSPDMPYALALDDAAHWLTQHERLMEHWRTLYPDEIHQVDYDRLVTQPREEIAALLRFCGLDWEDAVLDFHAAANPVKTASVWQVRQPLHGRSSGRWRNYAKQLGPLVEKLQRPKGD